MEVTLMQQLFDSFWGTIVGYLPQLVAGVLVLVLGWAAARLLMRAVSRGLRATGMDATIAGFIANLSYIVLLVLVVITALDRFGFPAVSFAAVVGAAGLAIGLGLKGTLGNLASGILLISLQPFKVGDRIDTAGAQGVVENIHVFATTLRTDEGKRIIVPNAAVTGGNITNHS